MDTLSVSEEFISTSFFSELWLSTIDSILSLFSSANDIDDVYIIIADNGKGIAGKDVSHIFERFYRTDESRNSKQGGSGIGLAIVKKIVEDHKGKIWAESVEGEGTTMHLNLLKYNVQNPQPKE